MISYLYIMTNAEIVLDAWKNKRIHQHRDILIIRYYKQFVISFVIKDDLFSVWILTGVIPGQGKLGPTLKTKTS